MLSSVAIPPLSQLSLRGRGVRLCHEQRSEYGRMRTQRVGPTMPQTAHPGKTRTEKLNRPGLKWSGCNPPEKPLGLEVEFS